MGVNVTDKGRVINAAAKLFMIYLAVVCAFLCFLILSAFIPKAMISENMKKSAEKLCERNQFFYVVEGSEKSRIDRYADSILMSIAFHFDGDHPLESVVTDYYYYNEEKAENENLLDAVKYDRGANKQYLRYWHGSAAVVRFLHIIMSVNIIYMLNAVVLVALFGFLVIFYVENELIEAAVALAAGLASVSAWYVPFSLEYTWVFFIMLVTSAICSILILKGNEKHLAAVFLITGMTTAYLDFLTAETITLTVPLLLSAHIMFKEREFSNRGSRTGEVIRTGGANALLWLAGYIGMWFTKWALAALVIGENVMPYIKEPIEERLGDVSTIGFWQLIRMILIRNVSCMLPDKNGGVSLIFLIIAVSYFMCVYRRKYINREKVRLYTALALVPYIRFLILKNHSFLHFFFTYRAQIVTVMAIVLIAYETIDYELIGADKYGRTRA